MEDLTEKQFYVLVETGLTPPRIVYNDFELAQKEAKRLHEKTNSRVHILEIVGTFSLEPPKPILETVFRCKSEYDGLPF